MEIRCIKCKGRMFDLESTGRVEGMVIRCPKCGYDNKIKTLKVNKGVLSLKEK